MEKNVEKNTYICIYIYITESLCCTSETLNYNNNKNKINLTKNIHFTNLSPLSFLFTFVENLVTTE